MFRQFLSNFLSSKGQEIDEYKDEKFALLLLDLQNDFLAKDGKMQVDQFQVKTLLNEVNSVSSGLSTTSVPIIYIVNEFKKSDKVGNFFRKQAAVHGSVGAEFDDRLEIYSELLFKKLKPDAFSNSELDLYLRKHRVNHLILAGVFADQCVYYTCVAALNRKYKVSILQNAVATTTMKKLNDSLEEYISLGIEILSKDDIFNRVQR
ncbi:MAG: cysteine hydrolase [Candidatus Cloacimonetes bacterium]|nr:cysteine hydrolase [Candidatus Cloacimonadota bacterium]